MRFGGPVFEDSPDPDRWVAALKRLGYSAAYCPLAGDEDQQGIGAYVEPARAADIVLAEVGAWSNPVSREPGTRHALRLERRAATLRAYFDNSNRPFIEWEDPDPLCGGGHRALGLSVGRGYITVSEPEVAKPQ